jgi:two-component system, OmpR family, heavy metal sensor histidine kinase CusS
MTTDRAQRRPLSLALRINGLVGATMTVLFVIYTALVSRSMELHFAEQDLGEIKAVAESLARALGSNPSADAQQDLQSRLSRAVAGHHGVYFGVHDASGAPLFSTAPAGLFAVASARPAVESLDQEALRVWAVDDAVYRGALLRIRGEKVLVAVSMASHLRYLAQLRRGLWGGALFASIVAVLAVAMAVRWGHAPLRRISATVRGITSEHLHVRLAPTEVPYELCPLVASFNEMLDKLEASFTRLTHFTSDIAHELRTPVTNLTTQTQVALSKSRDPGAYREVLYSSLEELERMGKMIGDMLYLAQADHQLSRTEVTEVDLGAEARALFDYFEAWAEEAGVELVLEGHAPAVQGNRPMLRRALSNLISNALRYTPRGKGLMVSLTEVTDAVEVSVENPGKEIAAEHLPKLFDRFFRADPARQHKGEGAGLGLAIVKAIAEAHGGTVGVSSAGGRTCFTLRLPVAARSA